MSSSLVDEGVVSAVKESNTGETVEIIGIMLFYSSRNIRPRGKKLILKGESKLQVKRQGIYVF